LLIDEIFSTIVEKRCCAGQHILLALCPQLAHNAGVFSARSSAGHTPPKPPPLVELKRNTTSVALFFWTTAAPLLRQFAAL
jgi:hypothetical protein